MTTHDSHVVEAPALAEHSARRAASATLRLADSITAFSGSMRFVALHVIWFGSSVLLNLTVLDFDPFRSGC